MRGKYSWKVGDRGPRGDDSAHEGLVSVVELHNGAEDNELKVLEASLVKDKSTRWIDTGSRESGKACPACLCTADACTSCNVAIWVELSVTLSQNSSATQTMKRDFPMAVQSCVSFANACASSQWLIAPFEKMYKLDVHCDYHYY